jgi:hypothetical protein
LTYFEAPMTECEARANGAARRPVRRHAALVALFHDAALGRNPCQRGKNTRFRRVGA